MFSGTLIVIFQDFAAINVVRAAFELLFRARARFLRCEFLENSIVDWSILYGVITPKWL
jgi:hypothetical protein